MRQLQRNRWLVGVLVVALMLALCGCPKTSGTASIESTSFQAITAAFDFYDLGMRTMRTLQQQGVISQAAYDNAKTKVAWPFYNAIKTANDAAYAYASAKDKTTAEGKMTAAMAAMAAMQKSFGELLTSLKKGGV